jgi:hypothetical protein
MIKRFIKWVKGLWFKSDISDEERSSHQIELFNERLKKNAFYERKTAATSPEAVLLNKTVSIKHNNPIPEFGTTSQKISDEFDQIPWARLTDDAKKNCISIAKLDIAKQSHIVTKLHESL